MKHVAPWILTIAIMAPLTWTDDATDVARLNMALPMTWESEWRSPRMTSYATCDRGAPCSDPYAEIVDSGRTASKNADIHRHTWNH